VEDLD
jgi:hypothetical protein